jgi:1-phosphatidylinositol-3-phosphate 5-kinase
MKNTTIASKAVKMDVIVLENLFYSKKCTQVFDLKGSERNRLVQQTNKQEKDVVLLDENFLICKQTFCPGFEPEKSREPSLI